MEKYSHSTQERPTLVIDTNTEQLLAEAQLDKHIKGLKEDEYFERVLVAGEMTELGIDSRKNFTNEDIDNIQKDLLRVRQEFKDKGILHMGLAKYLYRLDQVGISYPPLDAEEIQLLQSVPSSLRQHSEETIKSNLVYLPQLAVVLQIPLSQIAKKDDGQIVKRFLENELAKGGDQEINAMLIGGLLNDLDPKALEELIKGPYWKEKKWNEVLELVRKYKEEKKGYLLARFLPSLKKIELIKNKDK